MKNFSQYSRSLGRDFNHKPPEHEAGGPRRSAKEMLNTENVINGETSLDKYLFLFWKSHTALSRNPLQQLVSPKQLSVERNGICKNVPLGDAMPTK
jgi:hypothetical protein